MDEIPRLGQQEYQITCSKLEDMTITIMDTLTNAAQADGFTLEWFETLESTMDIWCQIVKSLTQDVNPLSFDTFNRIISLLACVPDGGDPFQTGIKSLMERITMLRDRSQFAKINDLSRTSTFQKEYYVRLPDNVNRSQFAKINDLSRTSTFQKEYHVRLPDNARCTNCLTHEMCFFLKERLNICTKCRHNKKKCTGHPNVNQSKSKARTSAQPETRLQHSSMPLIPQMQQEPQESDIAQTSAGNRKRKSILPLESPRQIRRRNDSPPGFFLTPEHGPAIPATVPINSVNSSQESNFLTRSYTGSPLPPLSSDKHTSATQTSPPRVLHHSLPGPRIDFRALARAKKRTVKSSAGPPTSHPMPSRSPPCPPSLGDLPSSVPPRILQVDGSQPVNKGEVRAQWQYPVPNSVGLPPQSTWLISPSRLGQTSHQRHQMLHLNSSWRILIDTVKDFHDILEVEQKRRNATAIKESSQQFMIKQCVHRANDAVKEFDEMLQVAHPSLNVSPIDLRSLESISADISKLQSQRISDNNFRRQISERFDSLCEEEIMPAMKLLGDILHKLRGQPQ